MLKTELNKVYFDNKIWEFDKPIFEAEKIGDRILIVFEPGQGEDSFNNLFCYNTQKELLWRIAKADTKIVGTMQLPYVGLSIEGNIFRVIDFYGRRFSFDLPTGKIISKDIDIFK